MKIKILVFLITFSLVSCVGYSTQSEVDEQEIRDILTQIKSAFNLGNIEEILSFYHPEFRHEDDDYDDEEIVWEIRLIDYYAIDFSQIEIDLDYDRAVASFILQLDEEEFSEPENFGDISYFYFTSSGWQIVGKDFIY